jgi:hypothetical protein
MDTGHARHRWPWASACLLLGLNLAGCSLLSIKSPERPLAPRELNARILTRELASQFMAGVGRVGEDVAGTDNNADVLDNTLRWEIAAVAQSRRAATQMAPLMSLLDSWALGAQMRTFMADGGAGATLFGTHEPAVRAVTDSYADQIEALARRVLTPHEFDDYQKFVEGYARENPLQDLTFTRASVIDLWSRAQGTNNKLVDSLGTIPEAMADVAQRVQMFGETVPTEAMRNAQLTLRESGYGKDDVQSQLKQLDERLERLTKVAEASPQMVAEAVGEVRGSLREVLEHLDASTASATQALRVERAALFADLQAERIAVLAAVDVQRKALAVDASKLASQLVKSSGEQLRYLAGEVLLLLIVLAVVLLGLPFAAGYFLARARFRHSAEKMR